MCETKRTGVHYAVPYCMANGRRSVQFGHVNVRVLSVFPFLICTLKTRKRRRPTAQNRIGDNRPNKFPNVSPTKAPLTFRVYLNGFLFSFFFLFFDTCRFGNAGRQRRGRLRRESVPFENGNGIIYTVASIAR